jgi:1,4-dihydroxy-6-naphthoate synthase
VIHCVLSFETLPPNDKEMTTTPQQKDRTTPSPVLELRLAHSPDSDDAFMFYALATRKVRSPDLTLIHVLEDIQTLNQKAMHGTYDITAISFAAYPLVAQHYVLLSCGASFGDRYGPIVVARSPLPDGLKGKRVAVPGEATTSHLALRLYEPEIEPLFTPFDQVFARVTSGEAEAGVVIHEGQLTYVGHGLTKILDLGEWWHQQTNLPLPLGGNAIRRSLGEHVHKQVSKLMKGSIQYAFDHREEALAYALQFARGLDTVTTDRFVSMYVNDWTLDCGRRGCDAVQTLLDYGFKKGLLPGAPQVEFVD